MKNINKYVSNETLIDQAIAFNQRQATSRGIKNDSAPSETKVSTSLVFINVV
jgi:hypothetical protein